ncbi:MAG TPA: hypothetical protein VG889_17645 [Rhizomicrobium sp.]|nr:hypothetical protein [Rhizomicrobium sp.]
MLARAIALLGVLGVASADAEPPPAAAFRDRVVSAAGRVAGRDRIVFRDDLVLELTTRATDQTVYIPLADMLAHCPADCRAAIDGFFQLNAQSIAQARAVRDARDAGADGLEEYVPGEAGTRTIIARSGPNTNQNTAGDGFGRNRTIPIGVDDFTEYMRAKLQLYSPYPVVPITELYGFSIGQGLGVAVVLPEKRAIFPFAYVHRYCVIVPGSCEIGVPAYIQARARELEALRQPEKRNEMLAFLALKDGAGGYRDAMKRKGDAARPAFGDFVEVCALSELARWTRALRSDPADAVPGSPAGFALCERDTAHEIAGMGAAYEAPTAADGIGMAQGDKYESSRLLFADQWRPLAQRLGGLLVAAPAHNAIVFARDGGEAMAAALRDRARDIKARSGAEALSSTVLRWNGNGWNVALDDDAGR